MLTLTGKSVFSGVAIGPIQFYKRPENIIKRYHIEDIPAEKKRFEDAKATALQQLHELYERALGEVGEGGAMIFEIHQMMLEDLDYCDSICNIIESQKLNAEYAVGTTSDNFSAVFAAMDDPYMQGRAADVRDVSERVLGILTGVSASTAGLTAPAIIAADDLAPSETVQLDKSKVLGFITRRGSASSHTAILARTMGIPAVVNAGDALDESFDGHTAIIDGFSGTVYIDPDPETERLLREKKRQDEERRALLLELRGEENITLDGRRIQVYANIGSPADVGAVLQNDAGGIGLFRSEFLYLESDNFPSEEQQFAAYRRVAETMAGKKVIIRTLDIGADKKADYFGLEPEDNPALGYRAIRICLTRPEIFKTQLRAICRASAFGKLAVMFPMIASLSELQQSKAILAEVQEELRSEGLPFDPSLETGIMIETPAAALISEQLAKEADFFSVGTNDLTQYTLACDRQNQKLEPFLDPHHPAILRLIKLAADNAHREGKWIGICGELGADPALTELFLAMGIDELSVSPAMVLPLRKRIRSADLHKLSPELLAPYQL